MMTETEVSWEILASPYETFPNQILNDLMYGNMLQLGSPIFTDEEQVFAQDLVNTLDPNIFEIPKNTIGNVEGELLSNTLQNNKHLIGTTIGGSTDVGDVCWITLLVKS